MGRGVAELVAISFCIRVATLVCAVPRSVKRSCSGLSPRTSKRSTLTLGAPLTSLQTVAQSMACRLLVRVSPLLLQRLLLPAQCKVVLLPGLLLHKPRPHFELHIAGDHLQALVSRLTALGQLRHQLVAALGSEVHQLLVKILHRVVLGVQKTLNQALEYGHELSMQGVLLVGKLRPFVLPEALHSSALEALHHREVLHRVGVKEVEEVLGQLVQDIRLVLVYRQVLLRLNDFVWQGGLLIRGRFPHLQLDGSGSTLRRFG
mmetsp:Transcript_1883/g.4385  ORF Transcript_1883/g.4385 Transcript_1883/m.4385 type:complete len:261 (-) Transcript_1883:430-1212(-)